MKISCTALHVFTWEAGRREGISSRRDLYAASGVAVLHFDPFWTVIQSSINEQVVELLCVLTGGVT